MDICIEDLPATDIYFHEKTHKCNGAMVLAVQLFNKIKWKKTKKELEIFVLLYFPHVMSKYTYFW